MEQNLKPERNLLLVKKDPESDTLESGLELPETRRHVGSSSGVILSAGPTAHEDYVPGRIVYFSPLAGTEVAVQQEGGDGVILFMGPDDILALGGYDAPA